MLEHWRTDRQTERKVQTESDIKGFRCSNLISQERIFTLRKCVKAMCECDMWECSIYVCVCVWSICVCAYEKMMQVQVLLCLTVCRCDFSVCVCWKVPVWVPEHVCVYVSVCEKVRRVMACMWYVWTTCDGRLWCVFGCVAVRVCGSNLLGWGVKLRSQHSAGAEDAVKFSSVKKKRQKKRAVMRQRETNTYICVIRLRRRHMQKRRKERGGKLFR